jgi:hypothetical protein
MERLAMLDQSFLRNSSVVRSSITKRGFLEACLLAISVSATLPFSAAAEERRFAVASLYNQTGDVTIHFSYRWGNENWRQFTNFRPGQSHWFAMPLDASGRAPELDIKIDEAIGAAKQVNRTFKLIWHGAPDQGIQFGHKHAFLRDTNNRDYVTVENIGSADDH